MTRRSAVGCLLEIAETLVLTLLIFLGIQTFVAQPYRVQQMSMERTLEPEQYVLVDKLTPRFDGYKRGDIVIFTPPDTFPKDGDTPFIKRVIGVAGDRVEVRSDGRVYVNGAKLEEPYVYDGQPTPPGSQSRWVVPPGEVFVMGDHRENSADSRIFGPVPVSALIGRAWLRYWPIQAFGVLPTPDYTGIPTGP